MPYVLSDASGKALSEHPEFEQALEAARQLVNVISIQRLDEETWQIKNTLGEVILITKN